MNPETKNSFPVRWSASYPWFREILFGISFIFLSVLGVSAQNADIRKEVHQVIDKYRKAPALKLDFEFQVNYPEGEPQLFSGQFLKKGELYKVDLKKYVIISDGKTQYTIQEDMKEVQITGVDGETVELSSPSGILKYLAENKFKYFDKTELGQGIKNLRIIELVPEDRTSEYFKIRFSYMSSGTLLKYIEIFSRDGTRVQLTIGNTSFSDNFPVAAVSWNPEKYKDYYIEDLRID